MMRESLQKKIQNSLNPINILLDERKMLRQKNPKFLKSIDNILDEGNCCEERNPKFLDSKTANFQGLEKVCQKKSKIP